MIKIAIVDDEKDFLNMSEHYLMDISKEIRIEFQIEQFVEGRSLIEKYQKKQIKPFDMLILDIEMPGINGMKIAREIRKYDDNVAIVFLTRLDNYAINGYEVGALDYIVKPINYLVFATKIKRIIRRVMKETEKNILVTINGVTKKVMLSDICFAEVINHRLHIHLLNEELIVNKTLIDFEKEISDHSFVRCNSGILVNLKYVTELDSKNVIVAKQSLPVSRAKYKMFLRELTNYVASIN